MLARAHTFTIEGLEARCVTVEVDIRVGLPSFTIVGLADAAVREARDRVRAAILNSGFDFPARRITANLAPGDIRKVGAGLDLALACAVLAASDQISCEQLEGFAFFGELSLDGEVRSCQGTLAVAQATLAVGMHTLILGPERACEATLVDGLTVGVAERLSSAVRIMTDGSSDPMPEGMTAPQGINDREPDLGDVRGQHQAVKALIIAAAGAHNSLLSGPPGTGKTMLAQRMPSILPPLSRAEAIEVTRIHSITGKLQHTGLMTRRPFRAPHHTATTAGLVGGAGTGWVGEIVLAHNGVLFLDELSEFSRQTLEALRQPLEDGRVAIVRAAHAAVYPARFMLVAATNPCPCGFAGVAERCHCSEAELARYRRKLSGPLLDRIDLLTHLERQKTPDLYEEPLTNSAQAREAVLLARERQLARFADDGIVANSHMDPRLLRRHVKLDDKSHAMLCSAHERGLLSARGQHRTLRVARTVADLAGSERVAPQHVAMALSLRPEASLAGTRAA